jgi:hypothetical protein
VKTVKLSHSPRLEAYFSGVDAQQLDYYAVNDDLHVFVEVKQLEPRDTVKVYWEGGSTTIGSDIKTVGQLPTLLVFAISKYEVIDVIGSSGTDIYYTLKKQGTCDTLTSEHLRLSATSHPFTLRPPTLSEDKKNLRVRYEFEFNASTTAKVWANGVAEWHPEHHQTFNSQSYLNVPTSPEWLMDNSGYSLILNYSLRLDSTDTEFSFSTAESQPFVGRRQDETTHGQAIAA